MSDFEFSDNCYTGCRMLLSEGILCQPAANLRAQTCFPLFSCDIPCQRVYGESELAFLKRKTLFTNPVSSNAVALIHNRLKPYIIVLSSIQSLAAFDLHIGQLF